MSAPVSRAVGNRRLLKLAAHLEKIPRERFEFAHWRYEPLTEDRGCGTVGCAVGHACEIPSFRRAGLRMTVLNDDGATPEFGGELGFRAAALFFGISDCDSCFLFSPSSSRLGDGATPKRVAEHIREFVRNNPPPKRTA